MWYELFFIGNEKYEERANDSYYAVVEEEILHHIIFISLRSRKYLKINKKLKRSFFVNFINFYKLLGEFR